MDTCVLVLMLSRSFFKALHLHLHLSNVPWPSGYELRLSLERSQILILVKVIGGRQEGHPVQKCSLLTSKVPTNNWTPS